MSESPCNQQRRKLLALGASLPIVAGVVASLGSAAFAQNKPAPGAGTAPTPKPGQKPGGKPEEILANNQQAKAFGYVEDATKSETRKKQPKGDERFCLNCNFYANKKKFTGTKCPEPDGRAACTLITAAPVRAGGYCNVWAAIT